MFHPLFGSDNKDWRPSQWDVSLSDLLMALYDPLLCCHLHSSAVFLNNPKWTCQTWELHVVIWTKQFKHDVLHNGEVVGSLDSVMIWWTLHHRIEREHNTVLLWLSGSADVVLNSCWPQTTHTYDSLTYSPGHCQRETLSHCSKPPLDTHTHNILHLSNNIHNIRYNIRT